jgi:hypothetical protein
MKKKSGIADKVVKTLIPGNTVSARLYRWPKIHKQNIPLQHTVDVISSPTYLAVKHLARLLAPMIGHTAHHMKTSADFIQKLQTTSVKDPDILISFDLTSMFTRAPPKETLQLPEYYTYSHYTRLNNVSSNLNFMHT